MLQDHLKYLFLFLLTFPLGAQTTYGKTELILPQTQVSVSIEKNQNFKSLEKVIQPNLGFLKEKSRFVVYEGVPARSQHEFSG